MAKPSNLVLTPNSGVAPFQIRISGTDLFERPNCIARETFSLGGSNGVSTDGGVLCWMGTNPTRIDGKIGKAVNCNTTDARYFLAKNRLNGSEATVTSGANMLFPKSTLTGPFYVSIWARRTVAGSFSGSLFDFFNSNFGQPSSMVATFDTDQIALAVSANGRLAASIGKYLANTVGAIKCIYSADNVFSNVGVWHNIVVTWNGVAIDPPQIYFDGILVPVTVYKNDSMTGFALTTNGSYCVNRIGYGRSISTATPPTPTNTYFNGDICDINVGNVFADQTIALKLANLPKVEIIQ